MVRSYIDLFVITYEVETAIAQPGYLNVVIVYKGRDNYGTGLFYLHFGPLGAQNGISIQKGFGKYRTWRDMVSVRLYELFDRFSYKLSRYLTRFISTHPICQDIQRSTFSDIGVCDVVLVAFPTAFICVCENLHYLTALMVSPPCLVKRGRIEILIGRNVIALSDDLLAHRYASPDVSEDISVAVSICRAVIDF